MALLLLILVYAFTFIASFHTVDSTEFDECLGAAKPISMNITGCDKVPCKFIKGENMGIDLEFEAARDITKLTVKVLALALGVQTNYPLPTPNGCAGLVNGECPLDAGEVVNFHLSMPILESFPLVSVIIQFYLESEHGIEVCSKFPGVVVV